MMTKTRNILIANLALSNIFLCSFTMPLSLLDLIHNYWPLASHQACTYHALIHNIYSSS